METAKAGDNVKVHYTGTLADGTQFDSSVGRDPLAFRLGSGMVIKGFDDGVSGMVVGEKKTIKIPSEDAYGPVNEELVIKFERAQIPADIPLEIGTTLNMHQEGTGQVVPVVVKAVDADFVTLDANHELAGKDLVFELELVAIN